VKNNLYNPKSTYHIPAIRNGRVIFSVHKKKVFCDVSNSKSTSCGSVSKTCHNLNVGKGKRHIK